jgi:subtilisin family serine protease
LNVVAAMGNTHRTVKSPPDCPAQARSAMSVAASTKSDTIWRGSSRGPTLDQRDKPDIVAPGSAILVACSRGDTESRAGTSYSAAIVSSVIALWCRILPAIHKKLKML